MSFSSQPTMYDGSHLRASNKNSLKLRLKSVENFSRGTRPLKFSALRKIILEFVWEHLTFFVTFLRQGKKVKKTKTRL